MNRNPTFAARPAVPLISPLPTLCTKTVLGIIRLVIHTLPRHAQLFVLGDSLTASRKALLLPLQNPSSHSILSTRTYALKYGRIKQNQLRLRSHCTNSWVHNNIIEFYESVQIRAWMWIAMSLADGGDLFLTRSKPTVEWMLILLMSTFLVHHAVGYCTQK